MVMVDERRRYVEVNRPARLVFRLSLAEMRALKIDDLTPPHELPTMEEAWARLIEAGCVAGPYEVAVPDGSRFDVVYYALADALPGQHVIAFAPAGWPEEELAMFEDAPAEPAPVQLTAREREILQLAAEGFSGPSIAEQLVVSAATVKTHFENVYAKLGVRDRSAAVARAMRLGLID
jgi:DNA-binding NarL/FixJ family response regulator